MATLAVDYDNKYFFYTISTWSALYGMPLQLITSVNVVFWLILVNNIYIYICLFEGQVSIFVKKTQDNKQEVQFILKYSSVQRRLMYQYFESR